MNKEAELERALMLAKLSMSREEKGRAAKDLEELMSFFHRLCELDVEGVAPMASPLLADGFLREDEETSQDDPERILCSAPVGRGNLYVVPNTLG